MTDGSFQIGWTTYSPLTGDEPPEPTDSWTSATRTDATDPELAELRRRVVDPVVASVLTTDELGSVVVFESSDHDIRVVVTARGERSHHWLHLDGTLSITESQLPGTAAQFASELEDFVAESRFAWGTQRVARYEIPPA